jgi:hypothetical protein
LADLSFNFTFFEEFFDGFREIFDEFFGERVIDESVESFTNTPTIFFTIDIEPRAL